MSALQDAIERPETVRSFAGRSPLHGLDRHTVGFADVLAQSVAAIAPAAASAMAVLMVADLAGGATVLVMALATVITFLVARTINQFTRRFAASGSLYTYAARGLGTTAGLATGAAIVVGYAFISVFALLGGAHYATMLVTRLWPQLPATPIALGALVIEAAVLAIVLVRGIRLSSRVALVVELVSVALILLLLIVLLVQIGPIHPAAVFSPDDVSVAGVAGGAVLAITAFVGFESSATLGVEARSPLKNIPRAIVWSVGVAGVFYLIAGYTQIAGAAAIGGTTSVALLDELASRFGLSAWAAVADVGIATSGLACAIASTTALTRIVFALARDGVAPAELGRTHRRHRTPIRAIAIAAPPIALVPIAVVAAGVSPWDAMRVVLLISASGYIVAYVLVCIAAPLFLRRIGEVTAGSVIVAVTAAAALTGCLTVYLAAEATAGNPGVWLTVGIAVIAAALIRWRRRAPLGELGRYDEPVAAHVLGGVARSGSPGDSSNSSADGGEPGDATDDGR